MTARARELLNEIEGCVCFKYHGSPYSVAGHSDLYGTIQGSSFFLEGKMPGKKPTVLQEAFLRRVAKAGAITGVYYSPEEAVNIVFMGVPQYVIEW